MKRKGNIRIGRGIALVKYNERNPNRSFVIGLGTRAFRRELRQEVGA
jgi:hypothetical protein